MKTVLVTGANRGIGLELCRLSKERGDTVIAVCRKSSPELDALGVRVEPGVDVSDPAAIEALAARLGGVKIDLLFHNAGILERNGLDNLDAASIKRQFEVNALGPLLLTHALLGNLGEGSKIGIVTSRMGSLADNSSGGSYGYRMSKAAVNMAGVSLAKDLAPRGVAVALLHPGFVRTEMTGRAGNVDPQDAARGLLARLDQLSPKTSGGFWHASGDKLPY